MLLTFTSSIFNISRLSIAAVYKIYEMDHGCFGRNNSVWKMAPHKGKELEAMMNKREVVVHGLALS